MTAFPGKRIKFGNVTQRKERHLLAEPGTHYFLERAVSGRYTLRKLIPVQYIGVA